MNSSKEIVRGNSTEVIDESKLEYMGFNFHSLLGWEVYTEVGKLGFFVLKQKIILLNNDGKESSLNIH